MAGFGFARRLAVLLTGLLTAGVHAATAPQRIAAVDNTDRVALSNGVSPRLRSASVLGAAAPGQKLEMSIRFSLTAAQQASLTQLLADQQNPASPRYHQWLTPEQFHEQFGLAAADMAKVAGWLQSQGFTVTESGRGGLFLRFSGTVSQANAAFSTEVERVSVNGVEHLANVTNPSLPAAISNVTAGLTGLHDFTLKPRPDRQPFSAVTGSSARPMYTTAAGAHYLAPGDLYTIYGVNGLLSSSVTGSGVNLAVVGQTQVQLSDIAAFRSAAGLSVNRPTVKLYGADPGSGSAADVKESTIDLEWAGAMAPSASVLFVTATDVINGAMTEAIDNDLAPVIANSYGDCEANIGLNDLAYYQSMLQQAAAQGITIVSAAGDSGATDCDFGTTSATHGLAVDFPASSPFVTAVGGTTFNEGSGSYWNSTNGAGGASAKQYIPEVAWNDSGSGSLASSGGGASLVFPKPSWQIGAGVPVDASRDVPDVSFSASGNHDPYVICLSGSCANGFVTSSGSVAGAGGTSVTSPVFAGLMALVVQKQGRVGVANGKLYALANSSYATNVFHDVTSGTNAVPCTTGTTDCSNGGTIGYTAGVGYDQATGWGSVDAFNLVNDWGLVSAFPTTPAGQTATVTNLSASVAKVAVGGAVTLTATAASGVSTVTTVPTGTFTFTVDSVTVGTATLDATGKATFSLNTSNLSAGTHNLQATYSGDAVFYGSKGAFSLIVTGSGSTSPDFTLTPANVSLGVSAGGFTQAITYSITPRNGFTGTVKFDATYSSTTNITKIFSASSISVAGTSPVTTNLTLAAYTGGDLAQGSVRHFGWEQSASAVVLAGMICLFLPSRRRRVPTICLILLSSTAVVGLSGCLGGGSSSSSNSTTTGSNKTNAAPGVYAITVTATATINGTAVTHSSNVKLTVQ